MDPYDILGIQTNSTSDDIKKAYRREAMKWHPDRNQDSSEAKERFHQAAEAYKTLSARTSNENDNVSGAEAPGENQGNDSESSDNSTGPQYSGGKSKDKFADSVFWNVMLDYAVKLAQAGMSENEIAINICKNGCTEKLANVIADKAFNIHAHYASSSGKKRKAEPNHSTFKEERLERELFRAFLGRSSFFWSPRETIDYYLMIFSEFSQSVKPNPLSWVSVNKRLMGILNFSIVLFTVIAIAVYFYPGPSEYKLLPDTAMLQVPLIILPLMFVWMLYRKLWIYAMALSLIYSATIWILNSEMLETLDYDVNSLLLISTICLAPFTFIALFANFLYYQKAQRMIRASRDLFKNHLDQVVWIRNRAGTSSTAAILFSLAFVFSLTYLIPRNWEFANLDRSELPFPDIGRDDSALEKTNLQSSEASEFFDIAESHFNRSPPDYIKAKMSYRIAADNGSVLAAYKLGYMHYAGEGASQNDLQAFEYFEMATNAPLAFQPHSLELTTKFLAESYNNLGIMYQRGLGTRKNLKQASSMYRRAIEFGSLSAKQNLRKVYQSVTNFKPNIPVNPG